jgi:Sulfatase-modifying factor enzyme 1
LLVETPNEVEITVAAEESLAQIGDIRFTRLEPRTIRINIATLVGTASLKARIKTIISINWPVAKRISRWSDLVIRILDILLLGIWDYIFKKPPLVQEFEIGKYPVTNIEYDRFITATGHKPPSRWKERAFPQEEANHPVAGISFDDANTYCKWLSSVTGNRYRLPTEWEWECLATGSRGWKYPWGEQFDKNKCNTKESGREGTTPVGSYLAGINPEGIFDLVGNVWEHTKSRTIWKPIGFLLLFIFLFTEILSLFAIISDILKLNQIVLFDIFFSMAYILLLYCIYILCLFK